MPLKLLSLLLMPILTLATGSLLSTTVNPAQPPDSVVVKLVGLIVILASPTGTAGYGSDQVTAVRGAVTRTQQSFWSKGA